MARPDITVAVCTYNRAELLAEALESLESQRTQRAFSYEILVVDDGSTDGTPQVVARFAQRSRVPVRCVRADGRGVGPARNKAVTESRGRWVAFVDDDERPEPAWLKELYAVAQDTGAPIVGGPVVLALPERERSRFSACCQVVIGGLVYPFDKPAVLRARQNPGCGNVLVARRVFEKVGLFSVAVSAGEDSDLWRRARSAGFQMWYAPAAVVRHAVPPYRLTEAYFKWNSLRWGDSFARRDWKYRGPAAALVLCLARVGKALAVTVPSVLVASMSGNDKALLDGKCALWRAAAYARRCLFLLAPSVFPQRWFFERLEFRRERTRFPVGPAAGVSRAQ